MVRQRVLVIENDPRDIRAIRAHLPTDEYEVVDVPNLDAAERRLREPWDAILLDLTTGSGLESYYWVEDRAGDASVILLSGADLTQDHNKLRSRITRSLARRRDAQDEWKALLGEVVSALKDARGGYAPPPGDQEDPPLKSIWNRLVTSPIIQGAVAQTIVLFTGAVIAVLYWYLSIPTPHP